ncbi:MAG: integration host factor subunit beta [Bacteroidetes bacterium]|nr:integration host factor subunit beta [Bacteroidota bacterium]
MTKADIVNEVVSKTSLDKTDVQNTIEVFLRQVKINMVEGKNIYFRGFGSFILKKRAQKIARNISKNTAMVIEEHFIPKFKPAKTFMDKVKKSEAVKKMAK